jgi:hypothetical protein
MGGAGYFSKAFDTDLFCYIIVERSGASFSKMLILSLFTETMLS